MLSLRIGISILTMCAAPLIASATSDPAQDMAILRQQDAALQRVGERLVVGGRGFCAESGRSAGMTVQRIAQYGPYLRPAARAALGIANRPTVAVVAAGGAAEQAGLRAGDVIAAVDGAVFPDTPVPDSVWSFDPTATALDTIEHAYADGSAQLTVVRAGRTFAVTLTPRAACRARFDVRAGRGNQATSDGLTVQVSSDLVARTRSDGELATVMAHELAHSILRHRQRGVAANRGRSSRQMEVEADRLGVYLMDAAGYAPADAVAFWNHWGPTRDYGIFSDPGHPRWRDRVKIIEQEAAVIAAQRAAGRPVRAPADLAPR